MATWNPSSQTFQGEILAGSQEGCAEGKAAESQFRYPYSVIKSKQEGVYFAADTDNHRIVRIKEGEVQTIAGSRTNYQGHCGHKDGPGFQALFNRPTHLTLAQDGSSIIVTDHGNHCIRRINDVLREEKIWVETLAGVPKESGFQDGVSTQSMFSSPYSTCWKGNDEVLIADLANHRIRCLDLKSNKVTTVAGNGNTNVLNCPVSIERVGGRSVDSESAVSMCVRSGSDSSASAPVAVKESGEFWLISRGDDRILAVEFGSNTSNADDKCTFSDTGRLI
eukprot:CAMPEP_0197542560 /NCGR_PEP_ID=MMETSP1318-20131121/67770_1 /TAXON_ID=552666 /ORGANISM="Partenskyella glossopodia, Strain RCC365" /LENGTH=278 /DNA_ID=CAMNT_0043101833 /DNA_START=355 /DNA_END=1191 /DNA_ORIENTATION=-